MSKMATNYSDSAQLGAMWHFYFMGCGFLIYSESFGLEMINDTSSEVAFSKIVG